jgi:PleD family two-component response regulator
MLMATEVAGSDDMNSLKEAPMPDGGADGVLAHGGRILFVEDEPPISEPFSRALEREGFEAVVAATGELALALADRLEPDLILLDLNLPDRDVSICNPHQRDVPNLERTAPGARSPDPRAP